MENAEKRNHVENNCDLMSHHKIFIKDSRHMNEVESESVHLIITSPPYWENKDYGNSNQIGHGQSLQKYLSDLSEVWRECIRVIKPSCKIVINIGDRYVRKLPGRPYQAIPLAAYTITEMTKYEKILYMGSIIWEKIANVNPSGGATVMGSFGYPRNGIVEHSHEYILVFKKDGKCEIPSKEDKEKDKLTIEEWRKYFTSLWRFPGARQNSHIAIFPDELPRRLIRMYTFTGDTVLDPFGGSCTVTKIANELNRNSICYEIGFESKDGTPFLELIKTKIGYNNDNSNMVIL